MKNKTTNTAFRTKRTIVLLGLTVMMAINMIAVTHAAITIPDEYRPKNVALDKLNKTISDTAKTQGTQEAAVGTVNLVVQYIANILLFFAAPLAVLFLARAGSDYAFAFGDQTKIDAAKRELTWAILGLVVIIISYVTIRLMLGIGTNLQTASDQMLNTPAATSTPASEPGPATTPEAPPPTEPGPGESADGSI